MKQEAGWGMQLAELLADHLIAMGAGRVEMAIPRAGHEFLVTVEYLRQDSAIDDSQHPVTESNSPAPTCH
jgi:hypothetical protein